MKTEKPEALRLAEWLEHLAGGGSSGQMIDIKHIAAELRRLHTEKAELRQDYDRACKPVADMHLAAMGEVIGPKRGVVEDIADLWKERDELAAQLEAVGAGGVGAMMGSKPEPMTRFCPGCGSVGPVPENFRDCCPDGMGARVIPAALAHKCHNLFQLALTGAAPHAAIAAQQGEKK